MLAELGELGLHSVDPERSLAGSGQLRHKTGTSGRRWSTRGQILADVGRNCPKSGHLARIRPTSIGFVPISANFELESEFARFEPVSAKVGLHSEKLRDPRPWTLTE